MKRLLFVLTIALVALSLNSAPVAAQASGDTNIDITLEGIVILHYFSEVDVTITSGALGAYLTGGTAAVDEGAIGPLSGGMNFNLNISPTALTGDPSAVVLTLEDAWAVRSLGGTGDMSQIAITQNTPTLTHTGGTATMLITGHAVDAGGGPAATVTFPSPGLVDAHEGDVQLTLDLTNATAAGEYEDGVFTLTATLV